MNIGGTSRYSLSRLPPMTLTLAVYDLFHAVLAYNLYDSLPRIKFVKPLAWNGYTE